MNQLLKMKLQKKYKKLETDDIKYFEHIPLFNMYYLKIKSLLISNINFNHEVDFYINNKVYDNTSNYILTDNTHIKKLLYSKSYINLL